LLATPLIVEKNRAGERLSMVIVQVYMSEFVRSYIVRFNILTQQGFSPNLSINFELEGTVADCCRSSYFPSGANFKCQPLTIVRPAQQLSNRGSSSNRALDIAQEFKTSGSSDRLYLL
jgi:hypothetical protein